MKNLQQTVKQGSKFKKSSSRHLATKDKEQSPHDDFNAQGFAMHCRAISNTAAISKFSDMRDEC